MTRWTVGEPARRTQVLVTSRPTASGQAEPDKTTFKTLRLEPLTPELQRHFVDKWCDLKGIHGRERHDLVQTFQHRSGFDHIAKLANNPMQLTILLYLINKKGEAVPTARTALYTDYLDTLLVREVSRKQIERGQVPQVQEITAFLGWHMQSGVEKKAAAGRMTVRDIETALLVYLHQTEGPTTDIEVLFRAASDRFWALTSKVAGTFEFAVQPLREYFAARFLAEWAGRDRREPLPKQQVLQQLINRGYWLNTARFYAGFASPNELASLRYGLEEAIESGRHPLLTRAAAWALLGDGIFADHPRVQRDVVDLLTDDLTLTLATWHPDKHANFPRLAGNNGGEHLAAALLRAVERAPQDPMTWTRLITLHSQTSMSPTAFTAWAKSHLEESAGRPNEEVWLDICVSFDVPLTAAEAGHLLTDPTASHRTMRAISAITELAHIHDQQLLQKTLDGWPLGRIAELNNESGLLFRALRGQWSDEHTDSSQRFKFNEWPQLLNRRPAYTALHQAIERRAGGHTVAQAIALIHGPCWLAADIAISGNGNPSRESLNLTDPLSEPFGSDIAYDALLTSAHVHKHDADWWQTAHDTYPDPLSRRTWSYALLAFADPAVVAEHVPHIDRCLSALSDDDFLAFASSIDRFGERRPKRSLGAVVWDAATDVSPRTKLILTHFAPDRWSIPVLHGLSDRDLADLAAMRAPTWPVAKAVTARFLKKPNPDLWRALAALGPFTEVEVSPDELLTATPELLEILKHPGRYPASWVIAVEHWHSRTHEEGSLDQVAIDQGWVPKVPHL
ncbi:NACHT domain-containing protein [Catenulispora yoronensis]